MIKKGDVVVFTDAANPIMAEGGDTATVYCVKEPSLGNRFNILIEKSAVMANGSRWRARVSRAEVRRDPADEFAELVKDKP